MALGEEAHSLSWGSVSNESLVSCTGKLSLENAKQVNGLAYLSRHSAELTCITQVKSATSGSIHVAT